MIAGLLVVDLQVHHALPIWRGKITELDKVNHRSMNAEIVLILQQVINNPNSQDAASRILYSGGRVAGASVVPNPRCSHQPGTERRQHGKGCGQRHDLGSCQRSGSSLGRRCRHAPSGHHRGRGCSIPQGLRGGEAGRVAMNSISRT